MKSNKRNARRKEVIKKMNIRKNGYTDEIKWNCDKKNYSVKDDGKGGKVFLYRPFKCDYWVPITEEQLNKSGVYYED